MKNLKKKLIEANNWNTNYTRQLDFFLENTCI